MYVKTMFAHGSHLGWRSWSPDTILKGSGVAHLCQNVAYQQKNLGKRVSLLVNSKPPHKRLKLMRIMSFCHIKSRQANVRWLTSYLNSLKSQIRKKRGTGIWWKVVGSGLTPKSWNNFCA